MEKLNICAQHCTKQYPAVVCLKFRDQNSDAIVTYEKMLAISANDDIDLSSVDVQQVQMKML